MYRILCQRPDGMLAIICDDTAKSEAEILERNLPHIPIDTLEYKVVPKDELKAEELNDWHDGTINAYKLSNGSHGVDMESARLLWMSKIRHARKQEFIKMGFPTKPNPEIEEAVLSEETKNKLQALRNIPQIINLEAAQTPEELRAIWPTELNN